MAAEAVAMPSLWKHFVLVKEVKLWSH